MAQQKTTSRKREEIEKELTSAKKLLETARGNFKKKAGQIKDLELQIQKNEAYLKNMKSNTVANHKVAGEKSIYERVQAQVDRDKKRLEKLKAEKKALGKEVAGKKYYVNRLTNELKLPFKDVKAQVRDDSQKANKAKQENRARATTRSRTPARNREQVKPIPEHVQKKAEKLGAQYILLQDSKGNRIFNFQKDGKSIGVITEKAGASNTSVYLETKSEAMQGLLHEAVVENRKRNSDFTALIGKLEKQYDKDLQSNMKIEPAKITPEINAPEMPKKAELKITPSVTLVPHVKRNGKLSKRNKDIQLMDADGKVVTLTEKMFNKMVRAKGENSAAGAYTSWDDMIEAAKNGQLKPEDVAPYFKGQVNLGEQKEAKDEKPKEVTQQKGANGLTAQDHINRHNMNPNDPMNNKVLLWKIAQSNLNGQA